MSAPLKYLLGLSLFGFGIFLFYVVSLPALDCDRDSGECRLLTNYVPRIPRSTFAIADVQDVYLVKSPPRLRRSTGGPYYAITLRAGGDEYPLPATSVSQLKQQLVIDQINAFLANPAQQQLRISSTQHPVMGIPLVLGGLAMGLLIKSAHRNRVPRVPRFVTDPQRPRGSRTTPPRRKKVKHH